MKKYPKYKDSGVEWIGEIPENWGINKVKYLSSYINIPISTDELKGKEVIHYSIPNVQEHGKGVLENGYEIDSSKFILDDGLLILSKLNPRKSTVCLVQSHENQLIVGSGEFIPLRFIDNKVFRFYQLTDQQFTNFISSQVESVTRSHQRIRPELLFNSYLLCPSLKEQDQIVDFLDHKTTIIDDLIQKKLRKIELLKEQKTSIINQTVTKGLNPKVKMKDSRVRWIGEIPEHWECRRLSNYGRFSKGNGIRKDEILSEGLPCIRYGEIYTE
jgi:type I restriction enzyme S subunit